MRRQKIGVLTFHKCINYGSYWQARCLVEWLRARGHDAELLDHDCECVRRAEAKCALQPKLPERTPPDELSRYRAKTRKFVDAIADLPLSRRFSLHEPETADAYDAIVIGSDEVWNFRHPWYGSEPIFFGDGLRTDRLIAYAASFGNHSAWDGIAPEWAEKLQHFSAVSVRDENSWHLIRGGTGEDAELVLDPCLAFPDATKTDADSHPAIAIIYGHGFPPWFTSRVRKWADDTGIRLVSIGYSNDWADEQRISASPAEFAKAMAGARAVITNFFHGCVFAILHGKPWATVPSDYRSIKIPDLAALLEVEDRLIGEETSDAELADLLATPEFPKRLEEYRARSEAYLNAALA
ncbi:MAG TPA: polysaccharide pyruvyl transferase family protein [Sphingomicrobium sp.]|nr:polysaccharide pyruvyl transferase family protein [Sphingomicrobium sp.]